MHALHMDIDPDADARRDRPGRDDAGLELQAPFRNRERALRRAERFNLETGAALRKKALQRARRASTRPTSSSTSFTLDDSRKPWARVPSPSSPGLPWMGSPDLSVARYRSLPTAVRPAGLTKRASSSWPISTGCASAGTFAVT